MKMNMRTSQSGRSSEDEFVVLTARGLIERARRMDPSLDNSEVARQAICLLIISWIGEEDGVVPSCLRVLAQISAGTIHPFLEHGATAKQRTFTFIVGCIFIELGIPPDVAGGTFGICGQIADDLVLGLSHLRGAAPS